MTPVSVKDDFPGMIWVVVCYCTVISSRLLFDKPWHGNCLWIHTTLKFHPSFHNKDQEALQTFFQKEKTTFSHLSRLGKASSAKRLLPLPSPRHLHPRETKTRAVKHIQEGNKVRSIEPTCQVENVANKSFRAQDHSRCLNNLVSLTNIAKQQSGP